MPSLNIASQDVHLIHNLLVLIQALLVCLYAPKFLQNYLETLSIKFVKLVVLAQMVNIDLQTQ